MDISSLAGWVISSLMLSTNIHPIIGWHSLLPSFLPIPPTACFAVSLLQWSEDTGLARSTYLTADTLAPLCLPVGILPVSDDPKTHPIHPLTFWFKPYSSFGLLSVTTVTSVHLR